MISNKKLESNFEREFCEILFNNGFWVHNFVQNHDGQPADVIAVKNRAAALIDCKVCKNDEFPLSRIEENQKLSMELWEKRAKWKGWFALKTTRGTFMMPFFVLLCNLSNSITVLNLSDIIRYSIPLEDWL